MMNETALYFHGWLEIIGLVALFLGVLTLSLSNAAEKAEAASTGWKILMFVAALCAAVYPVYLVVQFFGDLLEKVGIDASWLAVVGPPVIGLIWMACASLAERIQKRRSRAAL